MHSLQFDHSQVRMQLNLTTFVHKYYCPFSYLFYILISSSCSIYYHTNDSRFYMDIDTVGKKSIDAEYFFVKFFYIAITLQGTIQKILLLLSQYQKINNFIALYYLNFLSTNIIFADPRFLQFHFYFILIISDIFRGIFY